MTKTILLAEDDATLRELIRLSFEAQGVEVVEAADGEEAIEVLDRMKPNLILLDLLMPKSDGYAVLSHLREQSSEVPVIILSNLNDYLNQEKCMKLGAKEYFIKSDIDAQDLWPRLKKYLD